MNNNTILLIGIANLIWGIIFYFPFGLINIVLGVILIVVCLTRHTL